uniref:PYD and CARD domain containing n=1 Tax=Xiphophorus couchianus TaxID=32473 RepID=A0A3B5KRI3_9TELE
MASKTPRRILNDVLEDMSGKNFDKFRSELLDRKVVRQNQVEGKDYLVLTDVMIEAYSEKRVLKEAEDILRAIKCGQAADELVVAAQQKGQPSNAAPSDGSDFLDRNSLYLIRRVTNIGPILDELLFKKIIGPEVYAEIDAEPTIQNKVKKLINVHLMKKGKVEKNIFYDILKQQEPFLVAELEEN